MTKLDLIIAICSKGTDIPDSQFLLIDYAYYESMCDLTTKLPFDSHIQQVLLEFRSSNVSNVTVVVIDPNGNHKRKKILRFGYPLTLS